ncbi:UNVERIFIED_CONTAM: Tripartite DNA replication factor [Siphonaria sp. JEL0065]|nr:Tripartite DNA replication factor [Siphonaria sp. JEL0065]
MDDGGDEFDEFDAFDLGIDENLLKAMDMDAIMNQTASAATYPALKTEKIVKFKRLIVLEVRLEQGNVQGYSIPEKALRLMNEITGEQVDAKLRDDWYNIYVELGNYVHLITDTQEVSQTIIIDNNQNFIIVNPDTLISATHVADSFECLRKSVFQDMCRVKNDANSAMVYGKLLHEIFQACVLRRDFSLSTIGFEVEVQIKKCLEELWSIGETELTARTHLMDLVPNLQDWDQKYGGGQPTGPIDVFRSQSREKTTACVSNVLDIEEHIWSPTWGIKGNIDASLEVKTVTGRGQVVTHIMPFELKTGKSTTAVSHRAQASLYTLMMQDRYDVNVFGSLLYYLKKKELIKIPYIRDEIRGLLINRNKLASAITSSKLPEMIQNTRTCTHCYSLNTCLVYHKAVENGDADTSGLGSLFEEITKDLSPNHAAFFKKWEGLLKKEEGDIQTLRKEVWTMESADREKYGSCLSNMTVVGDEEFSQDAAKAHRFTYTLKKADPREKSLSTSKEPKSFLNLQLLTGDPIVISSEARHYALAIGFLTHVDFDSVTVSVDRRLKGLPKRLQAFDMDSNQVFSSIRMNPEGVVSVEGITSHDLQTALYRIDKDELSAGMALVRGNLTNLFIPEGDAKRRRLVVDLEAPTFRACQPEDLAMIETDPSLNIDQKNAMQKVLTANDYSLILGMPGTGKTTTIAQIIKALVSRGKSVLLTAYTHSAVDNVLLKLKSEGVDFIRLGGQQRVHPELRGFTAQPFASVEDVKNFYENKMVVATTCLGIKHAIFMKRKFDYCIVDEASQLTLPVCLGPLRFANVFVLVGDHYQLPPLVKNGEARDAGLAVSLFRLLSETHPESVATLSHQYRMCADIMHLSNTLIYGSRLRCGSAKIAASQLNITNLKKGLEHLHAINQNGYTECTCHGSRGCWIEEVIDPARRVVFVDTDGVPGGESSGSGVNGSSSGSLVRNSVEAKLVGQVVQGLIMCGVDAGDVGIMSPYRAQLKLIGHELKGVTGISGGIVATQDEGSSNSERSVVGAVEVLTIDKYQGRDKSCVLVSLVRSNPKKNVGDLLRDWRRLNVAFTRAKQKLIIFGSKSTLSGTLAFSEFLDIVDGKQWTLTLPKDAHLFHDSIVMKPQQLQDSATGGGTNQCKAGKTVKVHTGGIKRASAITRDIVNNF